MGVVVAPRRSSVFRHIEFLRRAKSASWSSSCHPTATCRTAWCSPRLIYTQSQLGEAANYLNAHYAGLAIEVVRERLKQEVDELRGEIVELMRTAVDASTDAMTEAQDEVVISGERNLLRPAISPAT